MKAQGLIPLVASALVYAIVAAILGREVLANLGSMIANDPGDPLLTAAILKWNATHVPLTDAWYQFPIFYPTRDTLTFSEHLLGLSVIASPLYWLTGDAVITYNLVLLLTYPLCGAAMFALVHRLTGSAAGAFVAGLAFAFGPYRISQLPHIQMLATFWAPLALLGLHAYLETGRRAWLVLYGATWMLQGAANGYALVFFSVLVGLWALWFVVASRKWHELLMIGLASIVAIVPLAPVLYKYASVHSAFGFVRGYAEIRGFSADIAALLCAPPTLTFWGWVRVMCLPEGELFPGVALTVVTFVGLVGLTVQSWRSSSNASGTVETLVRRVLLFVSAAYTLVIGVLLVSGPFVLQLGPLRAQASGYRKPIQILLVCLVVALMLSPGVRQAVRRSRVAAFYVLAALLTWWLALGPTLQFMGEAGNRGLYYWLMQLPGVDGLRVPARFWLMTTLCLSVIAGLVIAEMTRARSRNVALAIALIVGGGLLGDGWVDRIQAAPIPQPVPGASALAGTVVLYAPPDPAGAVFRDIHAVWRAVDGEWKAVNGYSGWGPSYYNALIGAGRAEADDLLTPFQRLGELHVVVDTDAPRMQSVVERQPGVTRVASDERSIVYRLPKRESAALPEPRGERLQPRELRSECAPPLLSLAIDGDETTPWQCGLLDERQTLIVDLGEPRTVGCLVNNLGAFNWLFPGALHIQTSEDGSTWTDAWSGSVRDRTIRAAMADPQRLRIVVAFPARVARYIRLRADPGTPDTPWTIADLEIWSSSSESR